MPMSLMSGKIYSMLANHILSPPILSPVSGSTGLIEALSKPRMEFMPPR